MTGAAQWKAPCPHIEDSPRDVCLHSKISQSNVNNWETIRLPKDVDTSDLIDVLEYVDEDDTVAICNSCRRINLIESGGVRVLHSGDPHYNDRIGSWLVELETSSSKDPFTEGSR